MARREFVGGVGVVVSHTRANNIVTIEERCEQRHSGVNIKYRATAHLGSGGRGVATSRRLGRRGSRCKREESPHCPPFPTFSPPSLPHDSDLLLNELVDRLLLLKGLVVWMKWPSAVAAAGSAASPAVRHGGTIMSKLVSHSGTLVPRATRLFAYLA